MANELDQAVADLLGEFPQFTDDHRQAVQRALQSLMDGGRTLDQAKVVVWDILWGEGSDLSSPLSSQPPAAGQ